MSLKVPVDVGLASAGFAPGLPRLDAELVAETRLSGREGISHDYHCAASCNVLSLYCSVCLPGINAPLWVKEGNTLTTGSAGMPARGESGPGWRTL